MVIFLLFIITILVLLYVFGRLAEQLHDSFDFLIALAALVFFILVFVMIVVTLLVGGL